jgi:putative methionine-R-sulfoxide reductase with GAF domain
MSIATDIASLEVLAKLLKKKELNHVFTDIVKTLNQQVPYFDWVGIYLHEGQSTQLVAASDFQHSLEWEANAELTIPLEHSLQGEMGKIVVKSRDPLCFDMTDVSTLETLAKELSERLCIH